MSSSMIEMLLIGPEASLRETIQVIDAGGKQIALMVGATGVLEGVVTDGDIRRALLAGRVLTDSVSGFESHEFLRAQENETRESMLKRMREHSVHQLPVLNDAGELVDLIFLDKLLETQSLSAEVVIMAGGRGIRLGSLTDNCPKPMLKIAGKPILEHIVAGLTEEGLCRITIAVNYLKQSIIDHFKDGKEFGAEITYLEEREVLGTAGALSLFKANTESVIVVNGDVLTDVNFQKLLAFHEAEEAYCTVCVRPYQIDIPYGVVEVSDYNVISIEEKPRLTNFVNAGVYVLSAEAITVAKELGKIDMTDLIEKYLKMERAVRAFPLHESWIDIGDVAQLDIARTKFN